MTHRYSTAVNNNRLDSIETTVGVSPKLRMYTGTEPANCAAASTGTMTVEITLPSDWMAAASAGVKAKAGTWAGTSTVAGTIGYYRIFDSAGTTCHLQGSCGVGTGDMQLDNNVVGVGQPVTVTAYSITAANT